MTELQDLDDEYPRDPEETTAMSAVADILLTQALRELSSGALPGAEALIRQALALPCDDREEAAPALVGATMLLFNLISDDAELAAPGDRSWQHRVETVHAAVDETAAYEIRSCVKAFDVPVYRLTPQERRWVRRFAGLTPFDADPFPGILDDDVSRTAAVLSVLHAVLRYEQELSST